MEVEGTVLKHRFFYALILILALCALPTRASAAYRPGCVRLHVVAADDGAAAQALKLEVRDACLARARALLEGCAGPEEAWARVNAGLDALSAAARARARACGYEGSVAVEAGAFAFPRRAYGDRALPAGTYRALRVVIGAGRGRNWWCVLYPSLCVPEAPAPDEPARFYSVLLRWLRGVFGGESA